MLGLGLRGLGSDLVLWISSIFIYTLNLDRFP